MNRRQPRPQLDADGQLIPEDSSFRAASDEWIHRSIPRRYSYHFSWMGRPIIQYPSDILALQELIWRVRPNLIVETGVAHGGSLVFFASMLELLGGRGRAIGIEVDLRAPNRAAIEAHPMKKRIRLLEGSSVDPAIVAEVKTAAEASTAVMIVLDSNHTHDHVLAELRAYAPLVTAGSYLVVMDTIVEAFPPEWCEGRPWGKGDNPHSAVREFLASSDRFVVDVGLESKLSVTAARDGYLFCVKGAG